MRRIFLQPRQQPGAVRATSDDAFQRWSFEGGTAPVVGAPFSATRVVQTATTYRDGNRTVQGNSNRRLYRDTHGRTRADDVFIPPGSADNPVPSGITINDPIAGKQYRLDPQEKRYNAVPWRGASAIHPPVAAPTPSMSMPLPTGYFQGAHESLCETFFLGEQVIDGINVVGIRVEHSIPPGTFGNQKPIHITVVQWFSPDLGLITQTTHQSSIGTEVISRLEHVVRTEPDAMLFTVPPDYTDLITAALAAQGRTPAAATSPAYYSGPVDPSRLPDTRGVPVLRTDFSNQAAWEAIRDEIQRPTAEGVTASVTFIDDHAYEGLPNDRLLAAVPENYRHTFMFVVDATTVTTPDHPVLVVNLRTRSDTGFRAATSEIFTIEANLSLGNLSFHEFAAGAAKTGVFRGF
jgi:hypothetical protein